MFSFIAFGFYLKEFHLITNITGSIDELSLAENQLDSIDSIEFKGISNLKKLDLKFNFIKSIENVELKGISTLEDLDLSRNKIDLRNKMARFKGVPYLRLLNLSDNHLIGNSNFFG